jgi:two-component system, sensor histidine kinase LadS
VGQRRLLSLFSILFCAVALCSSFWTLAPAADAAPLLLNKLHSLPLTGYLENLQDPGGALTLGDLLAAPEKRFQKLPGFLNLGYLAGTSWTRFSYATPDGDPAEYYLRLVPAFLDDVRVYVQEGPDPNSPASYREYQLGDHFPMAGRPIQVLDMTVPLPPTGSPAVRTVCIRVRSSSTHNLQGWIYPKKEFFAWSGKYSLVMGLLLGVILLVVIANSYYAALLRSGDFGYCTLYILSNLLRQVGLDGALFVLWPAGAHYVNDYLVGGGACLGVGSFSLFVMHVFSTRGRYPWFHRYLQGNILVGVVTAACIPFDIYNRMAPLMAVCYLLLACLTPFLAIAQLRRRTPGGLLLMLGFTVVLIAAVPRILAVLGLIPSTWVSTNAYIYGMLVQAVLLTMALVQRLHVTREQLLSVTLQAEARASELAEERTRELIVKQKELEQALAEKQQALEHESRFLDMVSHEYRTPLAIITGNLQIIDHYGVTPESPLVGPLAKIRRGARRMLEIFDNTLEHSRLRNTLPKLDLQPLNVQAMLEHIAAETRELFPERMITVTAAEVADPILGDHILLRTAFINLAANAVKYSPSHTSIQLEVRSGISGMILEIRDQGPGILPADRERLFEKYHRGSASVGTSGFGVGLWLVKRIIEEHGGTITLEDNVPQGTIVRVFLKAIDS